MRNKVAKTASTDKLAGSFAQILLPNRIYYGRISV
ncbi:hypothetical protein BN8_04146 [Fibrisoma limi BUZ 3]|uniref:Uncharacterized protein n=1 Tax=Fibrisoma limi BUZ 3 TaxID=1185876 RepID=I2GM00_9BACT|nr:hypothetical protein BN8_04146 [Fibrisoma limi BUZ 3]